MRRLALALYLGLAGAAMAQDVDMPPPAGTIAILCAYNSAAPSNVSGKIAYIQCDQAGNLILSPSGGASGPIQVQGNVASGAADSGNPVKMGGVFNSTPPTFANGQRGDAQFDNRGNLLVGVRQGSSQLTLQSPSSDGLSGANVGAITDSFNLVFNNTTWDRARGSATAGLQVSPNAYPFGGTAITGNATGTTGAVTGTLAGAASKLTYICGFDVSAVGGTAAVGPVTVAGLVGSSMVYQLSSSASGVTLSRTYTPCIPASAVNTPITVTTTADGTATAVDVNSWGYQQ